MPHPLGILDGSTYITTCLGIYLKVTYLAKRVFAFTSSLSPLLASMNSQIILSKYKIQYGKKLECDCRRKYETKKNRRKKKMRTKELAQGGMIYCKKRDRRKIDKIEKTFGN